ncbi:methyltransferase domain-containing protein [Nostoc sp. 2RC]|uniref:methyltransferase domain-containing protein n=1 Tax=Nostoc sp. 2RC TaxID=2485484 RepID=UPI00162451DC|nr:methyltransferase domain-containing protein [Nostoc sp. 2RC]MBC1241048.1 methyltransferase domain-containing protein [Nostoc sp. 2RC]
MTTNYVISGGQKGKDRLKILADVVQQSTYNLLKNVGISEGMQSLDVGCGGGDVTIEIAKLIGASGKVLGIDMDSSIIQLVQEEFKQFTNIEFRVLNAFDIQEQSQYDLAYSRFLLAHLTNPGLVTTKMYHALKPGGVAIVEETDFSGYYCYPESQAFTRYLELHRQVIDRRGGNVDLGAKVPKIMRDSGFKNVRVNLVQPIFTKLSEKIIPQITLLNIKEAIVSEKLASLKEVDSLLTELSQLVESEESIIVFARLFQVWGYK